MEKFHVVREIIDYCNNCHPGSKVFRGSPDIYLGRRNVGESFGPKIHRTMRTLSALSSDHGVRWLIIVRGVSRDLDYLRVRGVHIVLNPRCRESWESTCLMISGMPSTTWDRYWEIRKKTFLIVYIRRWGYRETTKHLW